MEERLRARQSKSINFRVHALASSLFKGAQQFYGSRFGLSVPEMRILSALDREGPLAASELVALTAMDKALVSRLLAAMDHRGFIAAMPGASRKRRRWALSRAGERLVRQLRPLWRRREAAIQADLSASQRKLLATLLERIFNASEKLRLAEARQRKAKPASAARRRRRPRRAAKSVHRHDSGRAKTRAVAGK